MKIKLLLPSWSQIKYDLSTQGTDRFDLIKIILTKWYWDLITTMELAVAVTYVVCLCGISGRRITDDSKEQVSLLSSRLWFRYPMGRDKCYPRKLKNSLMAVFNKIRNLSKSFQRISLKFLVKCEDWWSKIVCKIEIKKLMWFRNS